MKTDELRKKTNAEMERLIVEAKAELADLRYRLPAGEVKDTSEFRKLRKQIARLATLLKRGEIT